MSQHSSSATPDTIGIIGPTDEDARALARLLVTDLNAVLRGVEAVFAVGYEQAARLVSEKHPPIVLIDAEGHHDEALALMESIQEMAAPIVLSDTFDEDFFLSAHELGLRDLLIKPIPNAYLISRFLQVLGEHHGSLRNRRADEVLRDMGAISAETGVWSTQYFLRLLQQETATLTPEAENGPALVVLELGGYAAPLPPVLRAQLEQRVVAIVLDCARGSDMVGELFEDKFAVFLPNTNVRGARALAGRIMQGMQNLDLGEEPAFENLAARIGYADFEDCRHYEDLMNKTLEHLRRAGSKTPVSV